MTVLILQVAVGVALGLVLAGLILLGVRFAMGTMTFTARPVHGELGKSSTRRDP
jgi:hypothetical protein